MVAPSSSISAIGTIEAEFTFSKATIWVIIVVSGAAARSRTKGSSASGRGGDRCKVWKISQHSSSSSVPRQPSSSGIHRCNGTCPFEGHRLHSGYLDRCLSVRRLHRLTFRLQYPILVPGRGDLSPPTTLDAISRYEGEKQDRGTYNRGGWHERESTQDIFRTLCLLSKFRLSHGGQAVVLAAAHVVKLGLIQL